MEIATISFTDGDSGDAAVAIVRIARDTVGLALSLKQNGDLEVFLGRWELGQLIDALQKARDTLPDGGPA
jgi:hypothetical protein